MIALSTDGLDFEKLELGHCDHNFSILEYFKKHMCFKTYADNET